MTAPCRLITLVACLGTTSQARAGDHPVHDYNDKHYEEALQGFLQMQTERPRDLALAMNVGSAHYKLKQYELAERAFALAAQSPDPALRTQALYNLGNTAFQRGQLDAAEAKYQQVLSLDPNDKEARQNLAFVRQQRQQRKQEASKREAQEKQEQQQKQQEQQQQQQQEQANKQKNQKGQKSQEQEKGAKPEPQKQSQEPKQTKEPGDKRSQDPVRQKAERYLDSMSENRPKHQPPPGAKQRPRDGKDW